MLQWNARPSFYMVMGDKLTPEETDKACLERVKGFKAIGDVPITNNFYYIFHYIDSS